MKKRSLFIAWITSLSVSVLSLIIGASFHGLRINPQNEEGYKLGIFMGLSMIILFGITLVAFIILFVLYKRESAKMSDEKIPVKENCPCKRTNCENYGDCEVCRNHHHSSDKKPFTACERAEKKEERKNRRKRV